MINVQIEKIAAIKALREFTQDTFGVTASLLDAKNFVEKLQFDRKKEEIRIRLRDILIDAYAVGLTAADIDSLRLNYGPPK